MQGRPEESARGAERGSPGAFTGVPEDLVEAARAARERAYCPYSGFHVGAALLTASGEVVTGCNVENASYGLTLCAERSAVVGAVARGERVFRALALACDGEGPSMPCGACLQVLAEFAGDLPITIVGRGPVRLDTDLAALLPRAFGPGDLDAARGAEGRG